MMLSVGLSRLLSVIRTSPRRSWERAPGTWEYSIRRRSWGAWRRVSGSQTRSCIIIKAARPRSRSSGLVSSSWVVHHPSWSTSHGDSRRTRSWLLWIVSNPVKTIFCSRLVAGCILEILATNLDTVYKISHSKGATRRSNQ